jgi:C-terminal processing protease CtpA/Prc
MAGIPLLFKEHSMSTRWFHGLAILIALSLSLSACAPKTPTVAGSGPVDEPYKVIGAYTVSNDFVLATYYVENAVALIDLHGFVIRDKEWELPVNSQVLGFMTFDPESLGGTYELSLPQLPQGEFNDLDNDGDADQGVQVFAAGYSPNLYGGPFSEGDDRSRGWPNYLASIKTDTENDDEVIGGKLIVWAADGSQQFPTGYGEDARLFTADDPVAAIPAGYTIVDLDQTPFAFVKEPSPELALYEPADVAIKDFSGLSYTEAYDSMFEVVSREYAFNGVEDKQPDWDALDARIRPRVEAAEADGDANAYYLALRDFTWAFKDGHVGLSAGEYGDQDFSTVTAGGYGLAIRELDDGRVVVIYVLEGGPAAAAGIELGAELTAFDGQPIAEAISAAQSYSLQSSDFANRYQQMRYLLRAEPGTETEFIFSNPGGGTQTAVLAAVPERQSFSRTSLYFGVDTNPLLPVDSEVIMEGNAGVGYIRINSNYDDLNLVIRLFERALQQFEARQVTGIIIDMRYNNGGAPLGLAGFLHDQEIQMGQLEYYSDATGEFEPDGPREQVFPNVNQYRFDKMVLLVGPACFSACEIEAFGFSQVPGMVVVGQYPSAGVEAEVARGQFSLPEGFSLQVPTGRFTLPDGGIFLEGQGVQPTLLVPVDETTVFSSEDVVLQAGVVAVLQPLGAGITPSGPPQIAGPADAESALTGGTAFLEDAAREQYEPAVFAAPGVVTYSVPLSDDSAIWGYAWCALDSETLAANFEDIQLNFELNGEAVPLDDMLTFEVESGGQQCRLVYTALSDWPAGEHHLTTTATFTSALNDGSADYEAGEYVLDYTVYVTP